MLVDYVMKYSTRDECECGRCIDKAGENHKPYGQVSDLIFFKVAQKDGATKEEFLKLVKEEYPHWLDGKEHSYIEIGGDVGDQGTALMTMGLGELLDVWKLLTPNLLPEIPDDLKMQMAGMGMVTIIYKEDKNE